MNKYIINIIFFVSQILVANSQPIENALNVGFSYSVNYLHGKPYSLSEGFKTPSVYSNFNNSGSIAVFSWYKLNKKIGIGIKLESTTFSNWKLSGKDLYENSEIHQHKIFISAQYTIIEFKNNLSLKLQINPFIGNARTRFSDGFDGIIRPYNTQLKSPCSIDLIGGFESTIGAYLPVLKSFGLIVDFGVNKGWTKSILIIDKGYFYTNARLGFYYKLLKQKRYKYD